MDVSQINVDYWSQIYQAYDLPERCIQILEQAQLAFVDMEISLDPGTHDIQRILSDNLPQSSVYLAEQAMNSTRVDFSGFILSKSSSITPYIWRETKPNTSFSELDQNSSSDRFMSGFTNSVATAVKMQGYLIFFSS